MMQLLIYAVVITFSLHTNTHSMQRDFAQAKTLHKAERPVPNALIRFDYDAQLRETKKAAENNKKCHDIDLKQLRIKDDVAYTIQWALGRIRTEKLVREFKHKRANLHIALQALRLPQDDIQYLADYYLNRYNGSSAQALAIFEAPLVRTTIVLRNMIDEQLAVMARQDKEETQEDQLCVALTLNVYQTIFRYLKSNHQFHLPNIGKKMPLPHPNAMPKAQEMTPRWK